jgi:hypothetical protein
MPASMFGSPSGPPTGELSHPGERAGFDADRSYEQDRPSFGGERTFNGFGGDRPQAAVPPMSHAPISPVQGGPGPSYPRFDDTSFTPGGFDFDAASRHGRPDMTSEFRMPADMTGSFARESFASDAYANGSSSNGSFGNGASYGGGYGGGYGSNGSHPGANGSNGSYGYGGNGSYGGDFGVPASNDPAEAQRIDEMRRTFTPRRFGSGYDASQVNRLFDAIIASLSGRSGMPIAEAELDPNQFSLVPGGYFEAEVEQALRQVRDLIRT